MSSRSQVGPLIQELQKACRRPLFTEICLDDSKQDYRTEKDRGSNRKTNLTASPSSNGDVLPTETGSQPPVSSSSANTGEKSPELSWRELLMEATHLLPSMTDKEHGEVSHLISILVLGFLLPHSTGNEYFLLQNTPDRRKSEDDADSTTSDHILDYILYMDLEERLESTCRHYAAYEFGEFDTIVDANWELAFDSFLSEGLAPFLGSRPAHLQQVDLLHILAMIIHPQPSESFIPDTASSLEDKHFWLHTRKLMSNRHAHSFHVNYGHRLKVIKLLVQDLVLPACDPDLPMVNSALFDGALPHLRAALHAFAMGAVSMEDAFWARSALVTIAVQSRVEVVMKEEWEFLINRMVDDRTRYPGCKCCPHMLNETPISYFRNRGDKRKDDSSFCPHAGRGQHLADFLIRTCQARRHTNKSFLNEAFSSLTDAIEWQTHCWRQPDDSEPTDSEETPCMLASLLFAAKFFFYFLLPIEENQEDPDDNASDLMTRREDLISCAIQLCHHFDSSIAGQAAELVSIALAYGSKKMIEESAQPLCLSLGLWIAAMSPKGSGSEQPSVGKPEFKLLTSSMQNVVSAASRLSPSFAMSLLNVLLEQTDKALTPDKTKTEAVDKDGAAEMKDAAQDSKSQDLAQQDFLLRFIASISMANPVVAGQKVQALAILMKKLGTDSSRCQIVAALMATRQSRFFSSDKDPGDTAILSATSKISDRWTSYQMARLALRTGNFAAASHCFKQILTSSLSERYLIWISALSKVAECELCLTKHAAMGIPSATTTLRSALSTLVSLNALDCSPDSDFNFQIALVRLRLDFLDLLAGLRQLIREMRLTGGGLAKRTRSFLHFQNIVRCFDAQARRYRHVYRKYGLFSCQQTRTCLMTLYALCRFVARTVRVVFSDAHLSHKKEDKRSEKEPSGDMACPVSRFMRRLEEGLLLKMSPAIDPVIRAAAMLEVVDGILLCPIPFPIGFFTISAMPKGLLQLSVDPEQPNETHRVVCYPGISFDFYASGEIPDSLVAKAQLPFTSVLLWHRAGYVGPLQEEEHSPYEKQDDEHMADEKQEEEAAAAAPPKVIPRPWNYTLVSTSLLRNGSFSCKVECPPLREEGNYEIEVKLGCRDIRGGEWEIPMEAEEDAGKLELQVSRSGWHA